MTKYPPPNPPYVGPPNNHGPRENKPIDLVVIHSTVSPCVPGGARSIARYFMTTARDASAHYITDPEETIQGLGDSWIGYAAPPNKGKIHVEMCDIPGPVPDAKPGSALYLKLRKSWRWAKPNQRAMLHRTARLTARLCLSENLPPYFRWAKDLRNGARGVTTHAEVSKAWKQTTHWDPGWWPRWYFMRLVRKYYKQQKAYFDNKQGD